MVVGVDVTMSVVSDQVLVSDSGFDQVLVQLSFADTIAAALSLL